MRIAFYAPLKPPDHPVPSGDRRIAGLLIEALRRRGNTVEIASSFASRARAGEADEQLRLRDAGVAEAERLVQRFASPSGQARPDLWFTYHVYYKAPDWLGPAVADALGIPYVVAEASHAPKRAGGSWDLGHRATIEAIRRADTLIAFNRDDLICLPEIIDKDKVVYLPPFLDAAPFFAAAEDRAGHRAAIGRRYDLDPEAPWLLTVAMMRAGNKLTSYGRLAEALGRLRGKGWQLLIVGDGPAGDRVRELFAGFDTEDIRFAGALAADALPPVYAASDAFVWPAEGEAFGMALLEAQAAGLPVVAGATRGVPDIVTEATGILTPLDDDAAFADAIDDLLAHPQKRRQMGRAARAAVESEHDIAGAGEVLDRHLSGLVRQAA